MPHIKQGHTNKTNKKFLTFRGTTTRRRLMSNPKKLIIQLLKTTTDIWVGSFVFYYLLVRQVRSNQQTIAVIEKERKTCIACKLRARWQTQRRRQRKDDVGWGAIVSYRNKRHDLWQQHPTRCLASRSLCSSSSKCSLSLRLLVEASERAMYCEPPGSNILPATSSCCCCCDGGGGEHTGVVESIDGGMGFLFVVHKQQRWNKTATVTLRVGSEGKGLGGGGGGGRGEARKEGRNWDYLFFGFGIFVSCCSSLHAQRQQYFHRVVASCWIINFYTCCRFTFLLLPTET